MKKIWSLKEGIFASLGLVFIGFLIQVIVGPINWTLIAWPTNFLLLIIYIALLLFIYLSNKKVLIFRWMMSYSAAVPAIATAALATMIFGLTNWEATLSSWSFVLIYIWITTIIGLACINRIVHFKLNSIPFLLNHLGLFIAIICATLGNADLRRLRMEVKSDMAEWRAIDGKSGRIEELPFAIQLNDFTLEEYPAKILLSSMNTNDVHPEGILIEDINHLPKKTIGEWKIEVKDFYDKSYPSVSQGIEKHSQNNNSGATTAAYINATNIKTKDIIKGWISNGSYLFPNKSLILDEHTALIMPEREARRYASDIELFTESGKHEHGIIEVNKPYEIEGWKIYQLSYDISMGRWSEVSVLELVRDPWLPYVYAGIYMLICGAIWMFITAGKRKEKTL